VRPDLHPDASVGPNLLSEHVLPRDVRDIRDVCCTLRARSNQPTDQKADQRQRQQYQEPVHCISSAYCAGSAASRTGIRRQKRIQCQRPPRRVHAEEQRLGLRRPAGRATLQPQDADAADPKTVKQGPEWRWRPTEFAAMRFPQRNPAR
jgi:hypothetical protein